jgi:cell division protein FtsW
VSATDVTAEHARDPKQGPEPAAAPRPRSGPLAALRGLLERPLASYYLLLASVALLVLIGLVMVFSATSVIAFRETGSAYTFIAKQLTWAAIGLVAFWICQRLPMRTYRATCRVLLLVCFALVLLVDVLAFVSALRTPAGADPVPVHLGPVGVVELWLTIGGVQLQPAELAKLVLVLWGADVLVRRGAGAAHWRELVTPLFPTTGLLLALVGYNDFGTMCCLLLLFLGMLWAAGVQLRVFAVMFAVAVAGMTALVLLQGYRMTRLTAFLDPAHADPKDVYQIDQGLAAIANGRWLGVGLGRGSFPWDWLPNGHNDFIFAVIAEELGVVGCVVVLSLFGVVAYTGLRIARRAAHPYQRLVAAGITTWLVGQAVINIGGVTRLIPITGLPLPFISDGGTALIVALSATGILLSFARAEPDAARALHARPPRRWVRILWAPLPPLPRARGASDGAGPRRPVRRASTSGAADRPRRSRPVRREERGT